MEKEQILNDTENYKIFAVSGGPDSMYMLDLFHKTYPEMKIMVAHVNYHFRDDSDVDEKIVRDYCRKEHIKFRTREIDPKVYDDLKWNFEEYARNVRYDFFRELAQKNHADAVFVAHNQNDLVETFLLQQDRHNLVEYYGLKPLVQRDGFYIYRPLLMFKKSEILAQNAEHNLPYAIDATNKDRKYARNKIREELKEAEFPTYMEQIEELNQQLAKDQAFAKDYLAKNFKNHMLEISKGFKNYRFQVQKLIFIYFLEALGQSTLLLKRKKNTLQELIKLASNDDKPFITLELRDEVFVKDFNKVYLVEKNFFKTYKILLSSEEDIQSLKAVFRKPVADWIKADNFRFPYELTNDYNDYKSYAKVKNKRANRYFIDQKIPYRNRYLNPALIRISDKQIVNIKVFSKYEIIN